jgi:hypothetical protein
MLPSAWTVRESSCDCAAEALGIPGGSACAGDAGETSVRHVAKTKTSATNDPSRRLRLETNEPGTVSPKGV